MKENKTMKVKKVKWRDSQMYITQCPKNEEWTVPEITSVGFLLYEDKDKIVLAGDLIEDDVRRCIVIPKENISSNLKS